MPSTIIRIFFHSLLFFGWPQTMESCNLRSRSFISEEIKTASMKCTAHSANEGFYCRVPELVKCQRTPPESVYTSNNKYNITNQKSKEKQHVTTGIRTQASGVPGQRSNQLNYRDIESHLVRYLLLHCFQDRVPRVQL